MTWNNDLTNPEFTFERSCNPICTNSCCYFSASWDSRSPARLFYLQKKNIGFSDNLESRRIETGQIVFELLSDCCYCISSRDIREVDVVYVRTTKLSLPWTDYISLLSKISHYLQLRTKKPQKIMSTLSTLRKHVERIEV